MSVDDVDAVQRFWVDLSERFLLKTSPTLASGGQQLRLGRVITRSADGEGYTIRCAEKTVDSLLEVIGLSGAKVGTEGRRED